jgi:archaellum component FlaC
MIGATEGKEPDYVQDGDLKSLDELRGIMKDIDKAKISMGEKATVQGVATEITVLKQQLEMTHEQMRRLIGMYSNIQSEFNQFKQQRISELNIRVNGGSTVAEDQDYIARSSTGSTTPEDYDDHNN